MAHEKGCLTQAREFKLIIKKKRNQKKKRVGPDAQDSIKRPEYAIRRFTKECVCVCVCVCVCGVLRENENMLYSQEEWGTRWREHMARAGKGGI